MWLSLIGRPYWKNPQKHESAGANVQFALECFWDLGWKVCLSPQFWKSNGGHNWFLNQFVDLYNCLPFMSFGTSKSQFKPPTIWGHLSYDQQGVTKRCRLSWLTYSALVYEPKCGGGGYRLRGLSQWVHYICGHRAQINFGDLTPYLTYNDHRRLSLPTPSIQARWNTPEIWFGKWRWFSVWNSPRGQFLSLPTKFEM